jgi:hypothetical protein
MKATRANPRPWVRFFKNPFRHFCESPYPAQKAKLLQDAVNESAELPQTMEAVA